jgi:hypothetical protein
MYMEKGRLLKMLLHPLKNVTHNESQCRPVNNYRHLDKYSLMLKRLNVVDMLRVMYRLASDPCLDVLMKDVYIHTE